MKIVIADNMEKEVVDELKHLGTVEYKPADLKKSLESAEVLIVRSATQVTKDLLSNSKNLKIVARAGVGLDNVDSKACEERKIKVINTPAASTNAVAELAIASILNLLRFIPKAHLQMKNKIWDKKNLVGQEADGKILGIIGYGRIGSAVGVKAKSLGLRILAYDPHFQGNSTAEKVSLDELLSRSDIISLHTILTPETKHMINKKSISKMKPGAFLINLARGELVSEDDLYDACKSGKISGAVLDVFPVEPYSGKLLELDNVYVTPHIGASTKEAQLRIGKELVEKLKDEFKLG